MKTRITRRQALAGAAHHGPLRPAQAARRPAEQPGRTREQRLPEAGRPDLDRLAADQRLALADGTACTLRVRLDGDRRRSVARAAAARKVNLRAYADGFGIALDETTTREDVDDLFLASRESEVITGIVLPVDGGSTSVRGRVL